MRFDIVVSLLAGLEEIVSHDPPYPDFAKRQYDFIDNWFKTHRAVIDKASKLVLLSTILPERRPDRNYNLQQARLENILGRTLCVGKSSTPDLGRWRNPGAGDLAECIERLVRPLEAEMGLRGETNPVSVAEIDDAMTCLALNRAHSAPEFHKDSSPLDPVLVLRPLYWRLQAQESKWLTRLILKNYAPVVLPESYIMGLLHPLLPKVLETQWELPAAIHTLESHLSPEMAQNTFNMSPLSSLFRPQVGTKIGRQPFFKARSIKNCVDMAKNRRMAIEQKYDGEYCQIHINMSGKPSDRITIFSKSGRDSTKDRSGLHSSIRRSLRLDASDCPITKSCILEGEMVLYSDKEQKIMDFYKIRKHVSRGGNFIGTSRDSQAHDYEFLHIIYFDVMLLNDTHVLESPQYQRRQLLEKLVTSIPGRAALARYQLVDFSNSTAVKELREILAKCITHRDEGLVMKPCDESYFNSRPNAGYHSCCIKIKKEYFGSFGDVGDFAVVGAAYNAQKAKSIGIRSLPWTDFYIGCLENKTDVIEKKVKPCYVVVTTVTPSNDILKAFMRGVTYSEPYNSDDTSLRIEKGVALGHKPSVIFPRPPVFDLYCFSFNREGSTGFWTLRFPQVSKLHLDRTFLDTVTFIELQRLAETSRFDAEKLDSQEELQWIQNLETLNPQGRAVEATSAQSSPTPSSANLSSSSVPALKNSYNQGDGATALKYQKRKSPEGFVAMHHQSPKRYKPASNVKIPPQHPRKQSIRNPPVSLAITRKRRPLSEVVNSSSQARTSTSFTRPASRSHEDLESSRNLKTRRCATGYPLKQTLTDGCSSAPAVLSSRKARGELRGSIGVIEKKGFGNNTTDVPLDPSDRHILDQTRSSPRKESRSCLLTCCIFSFSPCIGSLASSMKLIITSHGGTIVNHPREWLEFSNFPSHCKVSGSKIRKILLVEKNRVVQTAQFLRAVDMMDFKCASGKRELVEVYDWRLLEAIAELETFERITTDLRKRFWIGAVGAAGAVGAV